MSWRWSKGANMNLYLPFKQWAEEQDRLYPDTKRCTKKEAFSFIENLLFEAYRAGYQEAIDKVREELGNSGVNTVFGED